MNIAVKKLRANTVFIYSHVKGKCPAYGKKCNKCNKQSHVADICRGKQVYEITKSNKNNGENKSIYNVNVIDSIVVKTVNSIDWWYSILKVENVNVKFKLVSGSDVNILQAYGRFKIKRLDVAKLNCYHNDLNYSLKFIIADGNDKPNLGLGTCISLGLISRINMVESTESEKMSLSKNSTMFL